MSTEVNIPCNRARSRCKASSSRSARRRGSTDHPGRDHRRGDPEGRQSAFGPNRELEARFNEETGQVDLFQYMTVVEKVDEPEREIALDDAKRNGLEAELGEELGFQIFWRPEDTEKARASRTRSSAICSS